MRTLTRLLVSVGLLSVTAAPASAQLRAVGFHAGLVRSRQIRERAVDSKTDRDFLLGVFVDPQTPLSHLSILAEASWTRRSASYDLALPVPAGADGRVQGKVRTDYLTFVVAPTARASAGPLSLFACAGPSTDILIKPRASAALHDIVTRASDQVFGAVTGAGLELRTPGGRTFRLEARMNWGLSAAYTSDNGDTRYRSAEFIFRIGRHPSP